MIGADLHQLRFARLGDRALRFAIPNGLARRSLFDRLRASDGVHDVVFTEELGAIVHDGNISEAAIATAIASTPPATSEARAKEHAIAVHYDGPDLEAVATRLSVTRQALIAMHTEHAYTVAMLGFLPGFAYLRGLDPRLVLPRRDEPRPRVPPSSVGIAAEYTGIYPYASPGGWHLLGRAIDFTPLGATGATLAAGDRVRFVETKDAPPPSPSTPATRPPPEAPHLEITKLRGVGLLVDGGRRGHMHDGVPPSGPLVASALASANVAVGNAAGACAVELLLGEVTVTARGAKLRVAEAAGHVVDLDDGASHTIAITPSDRVRYLALEGGIDVPLFLGSKSTLLIARVGGLEGRPLRRGDALVAGTKASAPPIDRCRVERSRSIDRIPIVAGPDVDENALSLALTTASFKIAPTSDRTGTRLEGAKLALPNVDSRRASRPMVLGAIELTPSGLIVLGPDHPTTGGYPVAGVVHAHALDAFFERPPGTRVSFSVE